MTMEPFSALNVATAAVQFVEFSCKTVSTILKAYQAIDETGSQTSFRELREEAFRLESTNAELVASVDKQELGRFLTKTESEIRAVATRCRIVANTLVSALEELDVDQRSDLPWAARMGKLKAALKAAWKKGKLGDLQHELVELRGQLSSLILMDLRKDMKTLLPAIAKQKAFSESTWGKFSILPKPDSQRLVSEEFWQTNIENALANALENQRAILQPRKAKEKNRVNTIRFLAWEETPLARSIVNWALRCIEFPEMSIRELRIAEAHARTYEWIFSTPSQRVISWHSFTKWLESDERLYWITGKAGSGKSTLMKFLVHDVRTLGHLSRWAGSTNVIVASYFFWLAGTETLQHSQEGLLRTLLYESLSQIRDVAPRKALDQWNALAIAKDIQDAWTWTDLEHALRTMLDVTSKDIKFCFFIDGLDELKGDISGLLMLLRKVAQYPHVKLCVSSRPWFVFGDEFSEKPHLRLEDLTYPDIKLYVESKLGMNVAFRELQMMDDVVARDLMKEITQKSSGVFLWVVIVVLSLEEGLREGDRLTDLRRRLDSLPPELDGLFRQIFHNFDPRYIKQASALFGMVKAAPAPLSLLTLSLADEDDPTLAVEAKSGLILTTPRQRLYRALNMRRRLDSRCKGLLEAAPILIKDIHDAAAPVTNDDNLLMIPTPEDDWQRNTHTYVNISLGSQSSHQGTGAPGVVITCASAENLVPQPQATTTSTSSAILRDLSKLPPDQGDLLAFARVEYLHRTVKDFLDQPDIWQKMTASTEESFNPCLSLARSYLLQFKWVHQSTLSVFQDKSWNAMFWILQYSGLAEAAGFCNVEVLEELRKATRSWFEAESACMYWPITSDRVPKDFLHLAVRCGLRLYLDKVLGAPQSNNSYIEDLLNTATTRYKLVYQYVDGPKFERNKIDLELVKLLVSRSSLPRKRQDSWLQEANRIATGTATAEDSIVHVKSPSIDADVLKGGIVSAVPSQAGSAEPDQATAYQEAKSSGVLTKDTRMIFTSTPKPRKIGRKLLFWMR